jgi:hypothetical protein
VRARDDHLLMVRAMDGRRTRSMGEMGDGRGEILSYYTEKQLISNV